MLWKCTKCHLCIANSSFVGNLIVTSNILDVKEQQKEHLIHRCHHSLALFRLDIRKNLAPVAQLPRERWGHCPWMFQSSRDVALRDVGSEGLQQLM